MITLFLIASIITYSTAFAENQDCRSITCPDGEICQADDICVESTCAWKCVPTSNVAKPAFTSTRAEPTCKCPTCVGQQPTGVKELNPETGCQCPKCASITDTVVRVPNKLIPLERPFINPPILKPPTACVCVQCVEPKLVRMIKRAIAPSPTDCQCPKCG